MFHVNCASDNPLQSFDLMHRCRRLAVHAECVWFFVSIDTLPATKPRFFDNNFQDFLYGARNGGVVTMPEKALV